MSLKARIRNYAKDNRIAAQVVLQNYMFECFLARLRCLYSWNYPDIWQTAIWRSFSRNCGTPGQHGANRRSYRNYREDCRELRSQEYVEKIPAEVFVCQRDWVRGYHKGVAGTSPVTRSIMLNRQMGKDYYFAPEGKLMLGSTSRVFIPDIYVYSNEYGISHFVSCKKST